MIAPDATTVEYIKGRPLAPKVILSRKGDYRVTSLMRKHQPPGTIIGPEA